jgi:ATP-dependent helicase HrpA
MDGARRWNYPQDLPVVEHRGEIIAAVKAHQVVIVVSDTGSGKTTQLPKMVAEALGDAERRRVGCTQPRRIAAASVSKRVADELQEPLGGFVGYQVRFEEKLSAETRIKFMTDGILLAETQRDRTLRQYAAIILDEAHERSLNIDFLLGYLKTLLPRRKDLKLIISSATLDAGAFAEFFADGTAVPVPVIEAPGRMFPVTETFLPPMDDEELPQHVARAVDFLGEVEPGGDVLVFLPGEREIRECADVLEGRRYRGTEVLPLFARLGLGDQQRVFQPGNRRRLILATNVAETSLTIPRIACVVDSGIARVNRWSPGRGVQRLQIEPVSQASARQRKGRCGRVREGVCVRLYDESELVERPEFTDPEIRRSSLAGVILRMKSLGLPEIAEFPFLDPPNPKAVAEGYRTLREVDAIDRARELTDYGRQMSRLPVDPRLARMLLEARKEQCLAEVLPIVAALESNDPRERPAEKAREADAAHARWKDGESDFIGIVRLWQDVSRFREGRGWKRNALRKYAGGAFLNARRVMEWANVADELRELLEREWKTKIAPLAQDTALASYPAIHRALLAGAPRQFGVWDRENKAYRSASGGFFAVFPGSGLFGIGKRWEWVMAMELVETTRLWARRVARIDPEWVEQVAPHLCSSRFGDAHWDERQGAVYGKETVICGGLPVVVGRRVHYGRVDQKVAHSVFLREGVLGGGLRRKTEFVERMEALRESIGLIEQKLRRPGGLWSEEAVLRFLEQRVPEDIHTAAAFHRWREANAGRLWLEVGDVVWEELEALGLGGYPDELKCGDETFTLYYHAAPGERDDGLTIGAHVDQLPKLPDWLPGWGVDGDLRERAEILLRSLPKDLRRQCQPIGPLAEGFAELWQGAPKDMPITRALAEHAKDRLGAHVEPDEFDAGKLPPELVTKIWVCDDDGEELAMGDDVAVLKLELADRMRQRFEAAANEAVERRGLSSWDGERLPEKVETPGGPAFPALVDEGRTVGVRAFTEAAEAAESHRRGGARLLAIAHADQVAYLTKKYPLGMMSKVELPRLGVGGTSLEDLVLLAAEGAAGGTFPRSPAEFQELAERVRGRWYEPASAIGRSLDEVMEWLPDVRRWIAGNRSDRNFAVVAEDLEEELAWLFRGGFAWKAGYARLPDVPRYLKAIRSRVGRVASLPLIKDLEKMERVRRLWTPWFREWTGTPDDPRLWPHGWALEELRTSIFAPDLPVRGKISEKRLEDAWEKLARREVVRPR